MRKISLKIQVDSAHPPPPDAKCSLEHVTDENAPPIATAVDCILDALWEMLSGVCRRHAIA